MLLQHLEKLMKPFIYAADHLFPIHIPILGPEGSESHTNTQKNETK